MIDGKNGQLRKIGMVLGCGMIVCALAILLWEYAMGWFAAKQIAEDREILLASLPPMQEAVAMKTSEDLPHLSVNGTDYVGLMQFSYNDTVVPIRAEWDATFRYPTCYKMNVNGGKCLIVGGNDKEEQFAFATQAEVADEVYFIDLLGNRYTFAVTEILIRTEVTQELFTAHKADLLLVLKSDYDGGYRLICCKSNGV